MKPIFRAIIILTLAACSHVSDPRSGSIKIDIDLVNVPHYSLDSIYLDNKNLIAELTDDKPLHNPTIYQQTLSWYSFQLNNVKAEFDSLKFKLHVPKKDLSTTTSAPKSDLIKRHEALDGTVFLDFLHEYMRLNWNTRENYHEIHSSLLDRTNSLFARHIDTSSFKEEFPQNSTWWGINSFLIFQNYFKECEMDKIGIGHNIVSTINNSTKYYKPEDKEALVNLITQYSEKIKTVPKKKIKAMLNPTTL